MVCKDKRKVVVQVKGHIRRALKCMDKKITKPLNIADFTRAPSYRRRKIKKPRKKIPLPTPPQKPHKKIYKVNPTFDNSPVDDIFPLRKARTRAARKNASTNPGYW